MSKRPHCARALSCGRQAGQSTVEALIALLVLLALYSGIAWVGRLQHRVLIVSQASRQAVFQGARGHAAVAYTNGVAVTFRRQAPYRGLLEVGGAQADAVSLRRDWNLKERGMLTATAGTAARPRDAALPIPSDAYGKAQNDRNISRQLSLLTGDGHAAGDRQAQQTVAQAKTAWQRSYARSASVARKAGVRIDLLDHPWRRAPLNTDWLTPWSDLIPNDRLAPARPE